MVDSEGGEGKGRGGTWERRRPGTTLACSFVFRRPGFYARQPITSLRSVRRLRTRAPVNLLNQHFLRRLLKRSLRTS